MRVASITETKNRLSALLDLVRKGETVVVTERGRPIARIVPAVAAVDDEGRTARLVRAGALAPGRGGPASELLLSPPPASEGSVLDALLEERREGR
jgi:prevent-host-death family protein